MSQANTVSRLTVLKARVQILQQQFGLLSAMYPRLGLVAIGRPVAENESLSSPIPPWEMIHDSPYAPTQIYGEAPAVVILPDKRTTTVPAMAYPVWKFEPGSQWWQYGFWSMWLRRDFGTLNRREAKKASEIRKNLECVHAYAEVINRAGQLMQWYFSQNKLKLPEDFMALGGSSHKLGPSAAWWLYGLACNWSSQFTVPITSQSQGENIGIAKLHGANITDLGFASAEVLATVDFTKNSEDDVKKRALDLLLGSTKRIAICSSLIRRNYAVKYTTLMREDGGVSESAVKRNIEHINRIWAEAGVCCTIENHYATRTAKLVLLEGYEQMNTKLILRY